MGAKHQLCSCYPSIINQVDSFHVAMLFPDMLITWTACYLCYKSRHIKCPVKYVHTYDQTRIFFLDYFPKRMSAHGKLASSLYGCESSPELFEFLIVTAFCCFLSPLVGVKACMSVPPRSVKWSSNMPRSEMLFLDFFLLPFLTAIFPYFPYCLSWAVAQISGVNAVCVSVSALPHYGECPHKSISLLTVPHWTWHLFSEFFCLNHQ